MIKRCEVQKTYAGHGELDSNGELVSPVMDVVGVTQNLIVFQCPVCGNVQTHNIYAVKPDGYEQRRNRVEGE